jgi:hypothetical protein
LASCGRSAVVPVIAEHLFASGRLQLAHLSGFVLGGGRDAGIAVNHACIVHQKSASQKPNCIKGAPTMHKSSFVRTTGELPCVKYLQSQNCNRDFLDYIDPN